MLRFFVIFLSAFLVFSCKDSNIPADSFISLGDFSLIPEVKEYESTSGILELGADVSIEWEGVVSEFIYQEIQSEWDEIMSGRHSDESSTELEVIVDDHHMEYQHPEEYCLTIEKRDIKIEASTLVGVYRGWQTLRQILYLSNQKSIGTGVIRDYPRFDYRGAMLDVARHFFSVDEVKRYIDQLTFYKINYLHLHLSDDQGWRIHINSWPELTAIGGQSQVDGGDAGFYTQKEYQDIVAYAADRFVTIVPEIDMPGHTNAALASYAELNCDNKKRELYYGREVGFSTLCVDRVETYQFAEDVIRELAEITPGPYIHIGGDETHATPEDDYIKFVNRVMPMVGKYGKKVIGWDEINLGELPQDAAVQFWASEENAQNAVKKGSKVLMSPASYAYLDMKYDSLTPIGYNWAGYIDTERAYSWDPELLVEGINREDILGIEAPLWGETITNSEEIEYLAFPRILGYAEKGWSDTSDSRTWDEYKIDLVAHGAILERLGINFYRDPKVNWTLDSD